MKKRNNYKRDYVKDGILSPGRVDLLLFVLTKPLYNYITILGPKTEFA